MRVESPNDVHLGRPLSLELGELVVVVDGQVGGGGGRDVRVFPFKESAVGDPVRVYFVTSLVLY